MESNFTNQYGDKFADGTRTLQYAKIAEHTIVNGYDAMRADINNIRNDINHIIDNHTDFKNKTNVLNNNTALQISKLIEDNKMINNNINAHDIKLNIVLITIYNILQIWPLRFLNKIFKWWTYQIINEYYLDTGNEYVFYVTVIMRGDKTYNQMKELDKDYKNKIQQIKEIHRKNNMLNVMYNIKPYFPYAD